MGIATMFHRSDAIKEFFNKNEHYDGFWDFVHENYLYDEQCYHGMDTSFDSLLESGFELAIEAGSRPVYRHVCADSDLILYFIGPESEILDKLNGSLEVWLEKYPQETPDQKNLVKVKKMREDAEQKVKQAKDQLKAARVLEKTIGKVASERARRTKNKYENS